MRVVAYDRIALGILPLSLMLIVVRGPEASTVSIYGTARDDISGTRTDSAIHRSPDPPMSQRASRPISARPNRPNLVVQLGFSNGVTSVVFSPDDRLVLAGSQDRTAHLWETASGREIRRFVAPEHEVENVAFSADGRLILTASDESVGRGSVRIWDAATGQELHRLEDGSSADKKVILATDTRKFSIVRDARTSRELYRFQRASQGDRSLDGRFELTIENVTEGGGVKHRVILRETESGKVLRRLEGHSELVIFAAFSPDAGYVVTASYDKTVRLWDAATGKEIRRLEGHSGTVGAIVYSPDGRFILTGSDDKTARLCEAATGREIRRFDTNPDRIASVAFSSDGRRVLAEDRDFENKWTRIWDIATGKQLQQFKGASSADGRMFLQSDIESTIAIVKDKTTGRALYRFEIHPPLRAFSPDGRSVVEVAERSQKIAALKDIATGKDKVRFKGHSDQINSVAFSSDGRLLLTGSGYESYKDNSVRLWNAETGEEVRRFEGNSTLQLSVRFSTDGRFIETEGGAYDALVGKIGGGGGAILGPAFLWDLSTGQQLRRVSGGLLNMTCAAYSPDGRFVLTGSWEIAQLWDAATGEEIQRFGRHSNWVRDVAFSRDGRLVLTGSSDGTARLWDAITGEELQRFTGHSDVVETVALSPDGGLVATGSYDRTVRVWDANNGKELHRLEGLPPVAFSPDGRLLITNSASGAVLWDPTTGNEVRRLAKPHSSIDACAFSADGRWVLTGCADHIVRLWETASGKEVRQFKGHTSDIHSVAFSRDGQYALSGSGGVMQDVDMTVRLWDVESAQELRRFGKSTAPCFSVAFSPDGKSVFAHVMTVFGADDTGLLGRGIVQLWDTTTGNEVGLLGERSPRGYAAFSTDANLVLLSRQDNTSRLLDAATGHELRHFEGAPAAISPDNRLVATGRKDMAITLLDAATGDEIRRFNESPNKKGAKEESKSTDDDDADKITALRFSPTGQFLAMGSDKGVLRLWDVASSRKVPGFNVDAESGSVKSLEFSADGRFMVSQSEGDPDTSARLWEVATGKEVRRFEMDEDNDHRYNVTSVALSLDGRLGLTWGFSSGIDQMVDAEDSMTPRLWDATSQKNLELRRLVGHSDDVISAAFSPDARFVVTGSKDGTARLWDAAAGKELCLLISFRDGTWAVVDPEGRFDTNNLEEIKGLDWIFPDDPFKPLPLEIFMRDYYEPRLLPRILAGEAFKAVRSLANLNRRQPEVHITKIEPKAQAPDLVSVTVDVSEARRGLAAHRRSASADAGVYDLRLFRDGQLVGYGPKTSGRLAVDPKSGRGSITFADIKLPQKSGLGRVEFSAYAFNNDRVKSATDRKFFKLRRDPATAKGRAYLITVGVANNLNSQWQLLYPGDDARQIQTILTEKLQQTGEYEEIIPVPLISDGEETTQKPANLPTKEHVKTVLDLLSGKKIAPEQLKDLPAALKIRAARPEDLVLISFSSHGYADRCGSFYFLPYDTALETGQQLKAGLSPRCLSEQDRNQGFTEALLRSAISSDELSRWLRDVDAGRLVMIVDACHSAAAVEGEGFKPGPMGSRGLGQLSYDKGMRILVATQADNVAKGSGAVRGSLLTYALMQDGIKNGNADFRPKDHRITLTEWLRYGVERVPTLYREVISDQKSKIQQPSLFDFARKQADVVMATRK